MCVSDVLILEYKLVRDLRTHVVLLVLCSPALDVSPDGTYAVSVCVCAASGPPSATVAAVDRPPSLVVPPTPYAGFPSDIVCNLVTCSEDESSVIVQTLNLLHKAFVLSLDISTLQP